MAATVRRIITLIVCALCSIQRAGAGSCSVPCTKPAATGPCFFREDVCPYPDGAKLIVGYGKLRSARSRAMPRSFCISHLSWPAGCSAADAIAVKYDSECVSRFKGLMCSLLFPVCRQGVVSPVCWSSCTDAYEVPPIWHARLSTLIYRQCMQACGHNRREATAICTKFTKTQQVAPDNSGVYW
jgi:hypothetical protein